MELISLILFFVYTYGLGMTVLAVAPEAKGRVERHIMRIGVGLGAFAILVVIMDFIGLPIDWKFIILASIAYPAYKIIRRPSLGLKLKLSKSDLYALGAVCLSIILLMIFLKGAFSYPWLEDDDSWGHALGASYVKNEKSLHEPIEEESLFQYIDPYPPAYDALMGVLGQTSKSINWTLKFFNSLLAAFGLVFFYFLARQLMHDSAKALFATFVLFSFPSFLSHFIWAHTLVIALFFVATYALMKSIEEQRWMVVAGIVIAGIFVTQPTQPIKFGLMWAAMWVIASLSARKINYTIPAAGVMAGIISLIWWASRWKGIIMGQASSGGEIISQVGSKASSGIFSLLHSAFPPNSGSATRAYRFSEIIGASSQNMINNPIGIGWVLSIVIAAGLIYAVLSYRKLLTPGGSWMSVALVWAVLTFLGFNTLTLHLPLGLYGFRFWMLFAVSASLVAPLGLALLYQIGKSIGVPRLLILAVVVAGIFFTSFIPKYGVNTSMWMSPGIVPQDAIQGKGYVWIKSLPAGTRVFDMSQFYMRVHGFDMYSCDWCPETMELREQFVNMSSEAIYNELKSQGYEYAIASGQSFIHFGEEQMRQLIESLLESSQFTPVHSTSSVIVFKLAGDI